MHTQTQYRLDDSHTSAFKDERNADRTRAVGEGGEFRVAFRTLEPFAGEWDEQPIHTGYAYDLFDRMQRVFNQRD
jgi:hypothetical protein